MNIEPILSRITIFPVKSLDGVSLDKAMITEGGCLLHDREYAIIDENENFVNGKANARVHALRSSVDFENEQISFRQQTETSWNHFHLQKEKEKIESYLSDFFGFKTYLQQNKLGRFLDVPDISGATLLSTASLNSVSQWVENISLNETRKRFRATLEIEGVPPFWEDHLFSQEGRGIEFQIGKVKLIGMSPRERCVVPTRNPETGAVTHAYAKSFAKKRAETLPEDSTLKDYGHYYYFSVDCHLPDTEIGKWIEVGDHVKIIGEKVFY